MKFAGTVIKVPGATPGLLLVNGVQRAFALEGIWQSPVAPVANQRVEVGLGVDGAVVSITVIERPQQVTTALQEHGRQAAELARKGVGALAARMGRLALGATVALWLGWFFLPAVTVMAVRSLTFWDLLGFDLQSGAAGGAHGLFAWLGLAAIAAPVAAPFVRHARAWLLPIAPAAYLALTALRFWWMFRQAIGDASRAAESLGSGLGSLAADLTNSAMQTLIDSFALGHGLFVLAAAAMALAVVAIKNRADQARPNRGAADPTPAPARPNSPAAQRVIGLLRAHRPAVAAGLVALAALAALVVLGFTRGGLSKGSLAKTINQALAQQSKPCWALQNNAVDFPVSVAAGFGPGPAQHPILRGLLRGGYITITRGQAGRGFMMGGAPFVIDLTAKGRQAAVWDRREGFCLGRAKVEEVVRWTEPVGDTTRVNYTWRIQDRPRWVDEKLFAGVQGIAKPVEGAAVAHKANGDWNVVF